MLIRAITSPITSVAMPVAGEASPVSTIPSVHLSEVISAVDDVTEMHKYIPSPTHEVLPAIPDMPPPVSLTQPSIAALTK